jgi:hypothetical protein
MRRTTASALILAVALAGPAQAATPAETAARSLASEPVYVHPRASDRLTESERGRVRLAIVREAIGRIKVAVLPASAAERSGGVGGLASQIDRETVVRGTLIVVAGPGIHAITSYPQSEAAVGAIRSAVSRHEDDRLAAQLLDAIPRLGRVDPGPDADVNRDRTRDTPDAPGSTDVPDADDFLDDIGDAFRIGLLIVAAAVALPFVLFALFMIMRVRRSRAREHEVRQAGEKSADRQLVDLGDEIRSLDLDTSMPSAPRAALTEYEQAIASYDQANELLEGEPSDYRVQQALAAIAAGRRHIEAARQRLG